MYQRFLLLASSGSRTTSSFPARGLLIAVMTEAVSTSEMSVNYYEPRCNIPEDLASLFIHFILQIFIYNSLYSLLA